MKAKIVIGIADCEKYAKYEQWMLAETDVETIRIGYTNDNLSALDRCDGILMTGGEDVAPHLYKKPEYLHHCDHDNMDEKRDAFELKMMAYSQEHKLPVLGICRGLQIANTYFGGTLCPDIPSFGKPDHSRIAEGNDRYHEVRVNPFSLLKKISGVTVEEVNSSHHQSADKIGAGLVPAAYAADGVVEAIERSSKEGQPFLMLVQWHPERMKNLDSPLSKNIKDSFLESARNFVREAEVQNK